MILKYPNNSPTNLTYWSLHEKIVVIDQKLSFLGGVDLCLGRFDNEKHVLFDIEKKCKHSTKNKCCESETEKQEYEGYLFPGLDYSNVTKKDFVNVQYPKLSCINRIQYPRLPWHDIQCGITGPVAFDVGLHFIQRWNFLSRELNNLPYEDLIPDETYLFTDREHLEDYHLSLQLLRSVSHWSIGLPTEDSIQEAYKKIITNSKKFIYIENQSFITNNSGDVNFQIKNTIGFSLIQRIEKAHSLKENFKVYIVLPLLPAFETENEFIEGNIVNNLIDIQTKTIYEGEDSFINILQAKGIDFRNFVIFLSLYKSEIYRGKFKGEQIYVHSKVLVADGTCMIIGSSNINDRSMLGERDSEICAYIEEGKGNEIQKLLECLLKEHLCLKNIKKQRKKDKKFIDSFKSNVNVKLFDFKKEQQTNSLELRLIDLFKTPLDLSLDRTFNVIKNIAAHNSKTTQFLFPNEFKEHVETLGEITGKKITPKTLEIYSNLIGRFVFYTFKSLCEGKLQASLLGLNAFIPSDVYF